MEAIAVMLFYQIGELFQLRRRQEPPQHQRVDGYPPGLCNIEREAS